MRSLSRLLAWRYVAGIVACAYFGYFPFVQDRRVPLLGWVDLGFHELGHMLTYPFPDVVTALMGSVTQVAVPLGLAAYFVFRHKDRLGVALCLAWAGASAYDAAVYIADAPYQRLPLIGGDHDWAFLLGPRAFDALSSAGTIAAAVKGFGAVLVLAGLGVAIAGLVVEDPARGRARFRGVPEATALDVPGDPWA